MLASRSAHSPSTTRFYLQSRHARRGVYSRQGCHLCDVVKETLRKLQDKADYRWREVDIDADRELQQKCNDEVPVVLINGRKAFKYHMSARDFLRVLAERE
jgi:glutaredoxin